MKPDSHDALVYTLDKGVADADQTKSAKFFNAAVLPALDESWKSSLVCEQPNRLVYNQLFKSGFKVYPKFEDSENISGGAFVLLERNRRANENTIIRAWNSCAEGTRLIVAGDKTSGINPLRKWFGTQQTITDSLSKFHSVVFWADKTSSDMMPNTLSKTIEGYQLAEGMFSSSGPDKGSRILVEHFSDRVRGKVADFGAGWGYLSAELLKRSNRVEAIDLFEADFLSLEAARSNLRNGDIALSFSWLDLTTEFKKTPYDWVIMNPPFHTGRSTEPDLGKRFIEMAASTLPSGGRLLMVANRNLPYEKTLDLKFRRFEKLEDFAGFKVIEAVK